MARYSIGDLVETKESYVYGGPYGTKKRYSKNYVDLPVGLEGRVADIGDYRPSGRWPARNIYQIEFLGDYGKLWIEARFLKKVRKRRGYSKGIYEPRKVFGKTVWPELPQTLEETENCQATERR